MQHRKSLLTAAIAASLMTAPAFGDDPVGSMPDDTWVSLTGQVEAVAPDAFLLDYGDGEITVEMDDWDSFGDAWPLVEGDDVTVWGEVDDDFYQVEARVEAGSVYVDGLNTFFYASPADEEALGEWMLDSTAEFGDLTYIGTVESVSPEAGSFTIDTGATELTVWTAKLPYDPLDDEGYQQLEPGDRVSVHGDVDVDVFTQSDLYADSLITLSS